MTVSATSTPDASLAQNSEFFNVTPVAKLVFAVSPPATVAAGGNAGSGIKVSEESGSGSLLTTATDSITLHVTGPHGYSESHNQSVVAGVATFDLSSAPLTTAGTYMYLARVPSIPSIT